MTQTPPSAAPGERRLAVGMVLGGIASVQIGSALATTIFDELGPGGAVLLRTAFAALVLALLWRPARVRGAAARDVALFGVVLGLMNLFFYEALDRLPLGIAVTLEFTGPLAVAVLGSRTRMDVVWAVVAALGILLFAPDIGNELDATGVAFALGAGAMWGCYILLSARVGRGSAGIGGLSTAMIIAAAILIPIGVHDGGAELLSPAAIATGLGVAILASVVPYALELNALRRLPANTFGVLLSLEPAAAAAIGAVALGQALEGREALAIALVVVASAGALSSARAPEAPQA